MKNRKILILCSMIAVLVICIAVGYSSTADSKFPGKLWGAKLNEFSKNDEEIPYAIGNNATITVAQMDIAEYFYSLKGFDEDKAREAAYEDLKKQEALYQKACQLGYSVTDAEIQKQIADYKNIVKTAENRNEILQVISQFDSEEAFWEYEARVFSRDMISQKYVADLEKKFAENNQHKDMNDYNNAWKDYYSKFREQLAEEENFQIVNE